MVACKINSPSLMNMSKVFRSSLPRVEICRWHAKRIESYFSMFLWRVCCLPQPAGCAFFVCGVFFIFFYVRAHPCSLNSENITYLITPVSLCSPFVSICSFVSLWTPVEFQRLCFWNGGLRNRQRNLILAEYINSQKLCCFCLIFSFVS